MSQPVARALSPATRLCVSLSARPSPFGTRFHNHLYQALGLDFIYKGFAVQDIEGALRGMRALGIRSAAISMPFKETVLELVDELHPLAREVGAVNTVVLTDGRLKGYNTDVLAVAALLKGHNPLGEGHPVDPSLPCVVLGSGGMARAILYALKAHGFQDITLVARNPRTGPALAKRFGCATTAQLDAISMGWPEGGRPPTPLFLINATPIGMRPDSEERVPFDEDWLSRAQTVMDAVASPPKTTLIRRARAAGLQAISGLELVVAQAVAQFELATGLTPDAAQIRAAAEHAKL